ncbi:MAG: F-type H+-transporting ATPase subunit epsilon [Pseudomonadota bacterium]|jgi:F-type H+-transporting ATPase subunit epsilon|nr:F-type H+-transporting ATPase subunit epsilon [Pseudomonadota bacterium]
MTTMQVDLVSSEEQIFSGEVEFVIAPGSEGEIGIYPRHIPLITKLNPGLIRVKLPQKEMHLVYVISGGFLEVQGNKVTVLADVVERTDSLDQAKLLEEKRIAEERLKRSAASMDRDDVKAYAALEMIIAQLKAVDYLHKQSRRS